MTVVYADGYAVLVCGGGKTAAKAAAVNTLFAPLSPPPNSQNSLPQADWPPIKKW
jgi:hypothetical protein